MPTRTWRGTINNNWNLLGNWLEGAVPLATDDVVFDATSPNCTLDIAGVALTLVCTNYTNTLTFTNSLTVSGNITLGASMGTAGTANLVVGATSTIRSNGCVLTTVPLTFSAATITATLFDNWSVDTLIFPNAQITLTSNTLIVNSTITINTTTSAIPGTTTIDFRGTTITSSMTSGTFRCPLTINSTSLVNVTSTASGFKYLTGTLTVLSSVNWGTGGLSISGTAILNLNGYGLNKGAMFMSNGGTLTLNSDIGTIGTFFTAIGNGVSGNFNILISSTVGVKRKIIIPDTVPQEVSYANFTDIDASNGKQIVGYLGTITRCSNITRVNTAQILTLLGHPYEVRSFGITNGRV